MPLYLGDTRREVRAAVSSVHDRRPVATSPDSDFTLAIGEALAHRGRVRGLSTSPEPAERAPHPDPLPARARRGRSECSRIPA